MSARPGGRTSTISKLWRLENIGEGSAPFVSSDGGSCTPWVVVTCVPVASVHTQSTSQRPWTPRSSYMPDTTFSTEHMPLGTHTTQQRKKQPGVRSTQPAPMSRRSVPT